MQENYSFRSKLYIVLIYLETHFFIMYLHIIYISVLKNYVNRKPEQVTIGKFLSSSYHKWEIGTGTETICSFRYYNDKCKCENRSTANEKSGG